MEKKFILIILAELLMLSAFSQNPVQDKNWEVVFQDGFETFNTSRWVKHNNYTHGVYNPSKGIYNEEAPISNSANVYIANNELIVETKKLDNPIACPRPSGECQYGGWHYYTSGVFASNSTYKYGYYETYAKLPVSSGYWAAFFLWNVCPSEQTSDCWYNEVDVFETQGYAANTVASNAFYDFTCPANDTIWPIGSEKHNCDYSNGYHWYGLEWDKNKLTWYVDHKPVRQEVNNIKGIGIQNPMYIILGVALSPKVDPSWGWANQINSSTIFPNYMHVDQANVYRLKMDCNTVINEIPNFNTFYYAVKKSITLSSNTKIPQGSNIVLRATDYLELKSDFEVPLGAEFTFSATPCY